MEKRKFGLCVTAIIKNEALYIEEWICYHRALEVDHFFIYDNNSGDNVAEVLRPYINHGIVTLIHWPMLGGQIDAYNHALRFFGHATEWMAYIDLDEFIVVKDAPSIPAFLASLEGADQVLIPWRNFGFSGHEKRPLGLVIENYTVAQDIPPENFDRINGKGIVRTAVAKRVTAHFAFTTTQATVDSHNRRIAEDFSVRNPNYERAQINHYYTKSFEEFEAKLGRGQVDGGVEKGKLPLNRPGFNTIDVSALKNLGATREQMALMQSLSPEPFRYGSQMGEGRSERLDPFQWAAKVAISNYLGDAPKLSLGMKTDFENLSTAGDVVACASEKGRVATLGAFRRSIHVADFLRRLGNDVIVDVSSDNERRLTGTGDTAVDYREQSVALKFPNGRATLSAATQRDALSRCYCVGFTVRTTDPSRLEFALASPANGGGRRAKSIDIPSAGFYCGIVELNKAPLKASELLVSIENATNGTEFFDFFAVAYG